MLQRSLALLVSASALCACGGSVELPLFVASGEVAVIAYTEGGGFKTRLVGSEDAGAVKIPADDGTPIFTWLLRPEDFEFVDGSQPTVSDILGLVVQFSAADGSGACGRCMAQTFQTPQLIASGDLCAVPPLAEGAIWEMDGDDLKCGANSESALCAVGDENQRAAVEAARRTFLIGWPGTCPPEPPEVTRTYENVEIRPIVPEIGQYRYEVFTQGADNRITGFHDGAAFIHDPATGVTETTLLSANENRPRTAVPLNDGNYLVAGVGFNSGWPPQYREEVFEPTATGLQVAALLRDEGHRAHNYVVLPDPEYPIYSGGDERAAFDGTPSMRACTADGESCRSIDISCGAARLGDDIRLITVLDNGVGVSIGDEALFYKNANPNGQPPITTNDDWRCDPREPIFPIRGTSDFLELGEFLSLGKRGNRAFVCGMTVAMNCQARHAVVLTATVTSGQPDWEIVYEGRPGTFCRPFVDVVTDPNEIRVTVDGGTYVDFAGDDGRIVRQMSAMDTYGLDYLEWIHPLNTGWTMLRMSENRFFYQNPAGEVIQLPSRPTPKGENFRALVPTGPAEFVAMKTPEGFMRVTVNEVSGDFPTVTTQIIPDTAGAFADDGTIWAAAVDTEVSNVEGVQVLLVGGRKDGQTFLARAALRPEGLQVGAPLRIPNGFNDLTVRHLSEVRPGEFIAATTGTFLLRIRGDEVTEVDVNFDDPETSDGEAKPSLSPDGCTGSARRLDAWRVLRSKDGVTWAGGTFGLIVRIAAGKGERFDLSSRAEVTDFLLERGDLGYIVGRDNLSDFGSSGQVQQAYWRLEHSPPNTALEERPARDLVIERIGTTEIVATNMGEVILGLPKLVMAEAQRSANRPSFAVLLEGSLVFRPYAVDALRAARSPFFVRSAAKSSAGYVLMAEGGRLALAVP